MEGEGPSTNKQDIGSTGEYEYELVKFQDLQVPEPGEEKRDKEENEDILENIKEVSTKGELSPRHTKEMQTGRKTINTWKYKE